MSETIEAAPDQAGRTAALAAYGLYILSIPSAALFAPVGLIVAYVGREGASPLALSHLNAQIRLFWIAFMWGVGLFLAARVAWILTVVLIGFALLWVIAAIGFFVAVWFTVKSVLGMLRLLDNRFAAA